MGYPISSGSLNKDWTRHSRGGGNLGNLLRQ